MGKKGRGESGVESGEERGESGGDSGGKGERGEWGRGAVSYTHLTLPTKVNV